MAWISTVRFALPSYYGKLEKVEGIEWIRVLYAYPEHITAELLETLGNAKKIIPYIDMPLQHINDRVLKRMQTAGQSLQHRKTDWAIAYCGPRSDLPHDIYRRFPWRDGERVCGTVRLCPHHRFRPRRRVYLFL